ncbi:MAG: hypothetical protein KU37_07630 [Sulfuricurvum sp. PC08-66]|nr:MAG: hypothetical protein KU37_07630 [Sulfuricurvum sp. PC08-66]
MKRLFWAVGLSAMTLFAADAAPTAPAEPIGASQESASPHLVSVESRDTTMEQAEELIKKALADLRKFDTRKIKSTVVIQGSSRSYSEPFYNMVTESIIGELNKIENIKINFIAHVPRVTIKGSPSSLNIARTSENDIEKIALKSEANTIFLWNLFEYNNQMNFIARIINTESKAIVWHYKVDKEFIKNDKLLQAEIIKYSIPNDSYIAVGLGTYFGFVPYERTGVAAADTLTANWMLGYSALYSTQSTVSPKLRLGAGITYITSGAPSLAFSLLNLYVDVRYQINEFIPPLYDSSTGEILQRRNAQALMVGATFGRTEAFADSQNAGGNYSLYANLGISPLIEVNMGIIGYLQGTLKYNTSATYTSTTVGLGLFNMFFNVNYKFNLEEEGKK